MIMDVEGGPKYVLVREGLCTEQKYLVLETENLIGNEKKFLLISI